MAYFHVLIKMSGNDAAKCVLHDLDEPTLKARFVKPYLKGQRIIGDESYVVQLDRLELIKIVRTARNTVDELAKLGADHKRHIDELNRGGGPFFVTLGRGNSNDELWDVGEDVTSEYLKYRPPGDNRGRVVEFLNHPWVLLVAAAVLATILAAIAHHYGLL